LRALEEVMRGLARLGKHEADASHLFEAKNYCSYFITHDERILRRASGLDKILLPSLTIVTLARFLEIYDEWAKGSDRQWKPAQSTQKAVVTKQDEQDAFVFLQKTKGMCSIDCRLT
jgi:hypothetical protein